MVKTKWKVELPLLRIILWCRKKQLGKVIKKINMKIWDIKGKIS
jgi:hypothetical protein